MESQNNFFWAELDSSSEPRSQIESAYLQLREAIIEGRHAPGERLRVEHLKDQYNVGAGTLREALALLVSDSLVVSQSQRGFRVAPMSLADIEDLTRTRTVLECAAFRDSMQLGDDEWEPKMRLMFSTNGKSAIAPFTKLLLLHPRQLGSSAFASFFTDRLAAIVAYQPLAQLSRHRYTKSTARYLRPL